MMQVGLLSKSRSGYAPSAVSLFLLMGYPVEMLSLQSVGTSLRAVKSTLAPVLPMLTETSESSMSGNFLIMGANLATPSSPSGLLSNMRTLTCPYSNISARNRTQVWSNSYPTALKASSLSAWFSLRMYLSRCWTVLEVISLLILWAQTAVKSLVRVQRSQRLADVVNFLLVLDWRACLDRSMVDLEFLRRIAVLFSFSWHSPWASSQKERILRWVGSRIPAQHPLCLSFSIIIIIFQMEVRVGQPGAVIKMKERDEMVS